MLPIPWNINPSSGGGGNFTSPIEFREEKKYCDYKDENKINGDVIILFSNTFQIFSNQFSHKIYTNFPR